jgi:hypothetical protein
LLGCCALNQLSRSLRFSSRKRSFSVASRTWPSLPRVRSHSSQRHAPHGTMPTANTNAVVPIGRRNSPLRPNMMPPYFFPSAGKTRLAISSVMI